MKPLLAVVPMLYGTAVVVAIFAGGLVPVAVVGGMLVGAFYTYAGRSRRS
ncbi:MAG TPA: hypothetical protein VGG88_11980 [Gaiellaceae bacterium]